MEAKSNIRRLLAGSSFIALLTASHAVLAAPNIITGTTGPQVVSSDYDFISVTSLAHIIASGGSDGLEIISPASIAGDVSNLGQITVSTTSTGLVSGIVVPDQGESVSVGGNIDNYGLITVDGVDAAAGILVYGSEGSVSFGGGVYNHDGATIDVEAKQTALNGAAHAAGILVALTSGINANISNTGYAFVRAEANSIGTSSGTLTVSNTGSADAFALGMGYSDASVFPEISTSGSIDYISADLVNNIGGVVGVTALAHGQHSATAESNYVGAPAVATARGTEVSAVGVGMNADAETIIGNVYNFAGLEDTGGVEVYAQAQSTNTAIANGAGHGDHILHGSATAIASGEAFASGVGINVDADSMLGDVVNTGHIIVDVSGTTTNTATATSNPQGSNASTVFASAAGAVSLGGAGMRLNADVFVGDFVNGSDGLIEVSSLGIVKNVATVSAASSDNVSGTAIAQGDIVSNTAVGMLFGGLDIGESALFGSIINDGIINATASSHVTGQAFAHVHGDATASVVNEETNAAALGIAFQGVDMLGASEADAVSMTGSMNIHADAGANLTAQATGFSLASANVSQSVAARAAGFYGSFDSSNENFFNDGAINVDALAHLTGGSFAQAVATGPSGDADATDYLQAYARGTGIFFGGNSIIGDFVNSSAGEINVNATALIEANAFASAPDHADAQVFSHGFADGLGIYVGGNSLTGDVSNAGAISVSAIVAVNNSATAQGVSDVSLNGNYANATALDEIDIPSYAIAAGFVVDVDDSMNGDVLNTGTIDILAATVVHDQAFADSRYGSDANAGSHSIVDAAGMDVTFGSLYGNISNAGDISVTALADSGAYAVAHTTSEGSATASVAGFAYSGATGIGVSGDLLDGDFDNSQSVTVIGVAANLNGTGAYSLLGGGSSILDSFLNIPDLNLLAPGGAQATGTDGAHATASGDAYSRVRGIGIDVNSVYGNISNSGSIFAGSFAVATNAATAYATNEGTAQALALTTASGSDHEYGAQASVTGISIGSSGLGGNSIFGEVQNTGSLGVFGIAGSYNLATAIGDSGANATATAAASVGANINGFYVTGDSLMGGVSNGGSIFVLGAAVAYNDANALASGGDAEANAGTDISDPYVNAQAIHVGATGYLDSFTNSDDLIVIGAALDINHAYAGATGTSIFVPADSAKARINSQIGVNAVGIDVSTPSLGGDLSNSGDIYAVGLGLASNAATASAQYYASAKIDSSADVHATGIKANDIGTMNGAFINSGDITAGAIVGGFSDISGLFSLISSSAFGGFGEIAGDPESFSFTGLTNSGLLTNRALANGEDRSFARIRSDAGAFASGINFSADYAGSSEGMSFVNVPMSSYGGASVNVGSVAFSVNEAQATTGSTSTGGSYAYAYAGASENGLSAFATGIYVTGGSFAGGVFNAGEINATGAGLYANSASAVGVATSEVVFAPEIAKAQATGSASIGAYGLAIGDRHGSLSLNGDIINQGNITVGATGILANLAHATATDSARAFAGATSTGWEGVAGKLNVNASGIYVAVQSLNGDFNNSGTITSTVNAALYGDASATGGSYAQAYAFGNAEGSALGIQLRSDSFIDGDVSNSGAITVAANVYTGGDNGAPFQAFASATDENGSAYAQAYNKVEATALGIQVRSDSLFGDFVNTSTGDLIVDAFALGDVQVQATGGSYASADISVKREASATGIELGSSWNPISVMGGIYNDGDITAHAVASGDVTVAASTTASGGSASVGIDHMYMSAVAAGITANVHDAFGDVVNTGALNVSAVGNIHLDASLTDDSSENYLSAYATASASAAGISVDIDSLAGSFSNLGTITSQAQAVSDVTANIATSGFAGLGEDAGASATASAYGIYAYIDSLTGNFVNQAAIDVTATASARMTTTASGEVVSASPSAYAEAYAMGMELDGSRLSSIGGLIANSSTIDVLAKALASATMLLGLGASASSTGLSARASARATGVNISGTTIYGALQNNGAITVNALAGYATGESSLYLAQATANANGFVAEGTNILGGFANDASIDVTASATVNQTYGRAEAYATGVDINADNSFSAGFENSNSIAANANGFATIEGGRVNVGAVGVDLYASSIAGGFLNQADAEIGATAIGHAYGSAEGDSSAYATGVEISGSSLAGGLSNLGSIHAKAILSEVTTDGYSSGTARATGLFVHLDGTATSYDANSLYNDGSISAEATAPDNASAIGVNLAGAYDGNISNVGSVTVTGGVVTYYGGIISAKASATASGNAEAIGLLLGDEGDGGSFAGGLYNSGLISAHATADASGTASATAIKLTSGSSLGGGVSGAGLISNTGVIQAVNKVGDVVTAGVAIDLTEAGSATDINQIGFIGTDEEVHGGIYGDIFTYQDPYADVINWSGGEIVGDIHGDTLDTFNVFAGLENSFSYAGNINSGDATRFGTLNVNPIDPTYAPVSLTVSGNMSLSGLNVNNAGTLVVDSTADIDTTSLAVAGDVDEYSAGTIQWNLNPVDPTNGVIKAADVTLGDGANSIANGSYGLYKPVTDYWLIEKTGASLSGTFTNFSVIGFLADNNLYDVSEVYNGSGGQGYHIVVTRHSFSGIPGMTIDGINFGSYLDGLLDDLSTENPDLYDQINAVLTGDPEHAAENYAELMNELSGHQNADLLLAALGGPQKLMEIIFGQLGGEGGGNSGIAGLDTLVRVADSGISATSNDAGPQYAALGDPTIFKRPASAWVRVFGSWSNLDSDAAVGAKGYSADGGGVIVGADYRFTDSFKAGVAGGYQKSTITFGSNGGKADLDSYSLNAYGRYEQGPLYVNGMLGVSYQSYDMTRNYVIGLANYQAHRNPDGQAVAGGAEIGYDFDLGNTATLTPFLSFLYAHTSIDGSTETGTGPANLVVQDQSGDSETSHLGMRWSQIYKTDGGTSWKPMLELGWKHEFADTNPTTTSALSGLGGSYIVNGAKSPTDFATVGAGLNVQLTDAVDGTVQYNGDFGDTQTSSTASLKLRLKF